jgi:hypothetical protein
VGIGARGGNEVTLVATLFYFFGLWNCFNTKYIILLSSSNRSVKTGLRISGVDTGIYVVGTVGPEVTRKGVDCNDCCRVTPRLRRFSGLGLRWNGWVVQHFIPTEVRELMSYLAEGGSWTREDSWATTSF